MKYISKANDNFIDIMDLDEYDIEEIRVSITRNFNIKNISEIYFITKIKQVNEMRYKQQFKYFKSNNLHLI